MITAVHNIVFAEDAAATRAFFRDVLGLPFVDAHDGWLIFRLPPAELGIHPSDDTGMRHEMWLMCDDIHATVRDLQAKGVRVTSEVTEQSFGMVTAIEVPGGGTMGLYQPSHATAHDLAPGTSA